MSFTPRLSLLLLAAALAAPARAASADERAAIERMYRAGEAAQAMLKLESALAASPADASLRFLKGVLLAEQHRDAEAAEVYQRLTEDFPGLAEPERGTIEAPAVLRQWDGVALPDRFTHRFGAPTLLVNDAHALAYGEHLADDRRRSLVVVKAATGIGAGLVIDGRLHRGDSMGAGQIGHMRLPGARTRCVCGEIGCLATVASGRALLRALPRATTLDDVRAAVEAGDATAVRAVRRAGDAVGVILSGIVTAVDPGAVLFGGILGRLDVFVDAARRQIEAHAYARTARHVHVGTTVLGEESAVAGLAGLVVDSRLSAAAVDALVRGRAMP